MKYGGDVEIELVAKRNSNIELSRLVKMVSYFTILGYISNETHTVQSNTVWLLFWELFRKIGVDLFVLILATLPLIPDQYFVFQTVRSIYCFITVYAILYIFFQIVYLDFSAICVALES